MSNLGVPQFCYGRDLPPKAVAVARISANPSGPKDLVDINNSVYGSGSLVINAYKIVASWDAAVVGNTVAITGADMYLFENQFFEITDEVDQEGKPLYYKHTLPSSQVDTVTVTDLAGNTIEDGYVIRDGAILHSFDGAPYHVGYYENQVHKSRLLQYDPVLVRAPQPAAGAYSFSVGGILTVLGPEYTFRVRFTKVNGYQILTPYNVPANDPWYPRIRFNLRPVAPEWPRQQFLPVRPYMLATWVPGRVLARNLIEFERPQIYFDPNTRQYPDILVYDKDYNLKLALDGVPPGLNGAPDKGYLFNWSTSRILDLDPLHARVEVNAELADDDRVFGFYSYAEPDILFRDLDVNPFTNPAIKDRVVSFYFKSQPTLDPLRNVYYEIRRSDGTLEQTSDPYPASGSKHFFGTLVVGFSVGVDEFATVDVRARGGGLAPEYQSIEQAQHMWDLGFWDGKPYPLGGSMVVLLPVALRGSFSADEIKAKVEEIVPAGVLPVIRYYDAEGNEQLSVEHAQLFDSTPGLFDDTLGLFDKGGV